MPEARILIVEDEGIQALDMQHRLVALGYPYPAVASSAEEAIARAKEVRPDLVLMDIMLPGEIDGITAAERLRADYEIPIIYITAFADEETLTRARVTEPYGYLVKPFKERDLHISIDMALYKHKMERKIKESEKWFSTTLKSIGDAVITTDQDGTITFMNAVAEDLTGWTLKEVQGRKLVDFFNIINRDTRRPAENPVVKVLLLGSVVGLANHTLLIARNGKEIPIDDSAAPIKDDQGNVLGVILVFRNIEERDRLDRENEMTVEFLHLINQSTGFADLIQSAVDFFQRKSGCEAVGIRLREGEDYPYYEVRGFPQEFVLLENELCQKDAAGALVRDSEGSPVIECMCGNVICGRFDDAKPFFTQGGSFWTNSTTELLASTSEADRQSRTRNRCNGEGYESVALFPLCQGRERLGLLQLNDRSRGVFTPHAISLWERMSGYLAIALSKFRAEEATLRAKEEWERTFKSIPDLIAILDKEHRVVRVNQAMATRLGLAPEKCIGVKCHEAVHGLPYPPAFCPHAMTCQDGQEHIAEVHEPILGGDFLVSTTPLLDEKSELIGAIHVARDISERKQMEEKLREKSDHLEAANNDLEAFTYSVSHDLRAPLRTINGYVHMILRKHADAFDEEVVKRFNVIKSSTLMMGQLIDDLLSFSRLGRARLSMMQLDMDELIREAWEEVAADCDGSRPDFQISEIPPGWGDRALIKQVICNLLSNAVKFSSLRDDAQIHVSGCQNDDEIIYSVKDNGVGFDMQFYDKLFCVFQRLHGMDDFEGTGVGLAIVQRIVHRHGGRVWAEGKENEGAKFFFSLPSIPAS